MLCAVHPRFNQRIQLIQALAPLARLHRQVKFDSFQVRQLMKFIKVIAGHFNLSLNFHLEFT